VSRTDLYIDSKHSNLNPNQKQHNFKLHHGFETSKLSCSTLTLSNTLIGQSCSIQCQESNGGLWSFCLIIEGFRKVERRQMKKKKQFKETVIILRWIWIIYLFLFIYYFHFNNKIFIYYLKYINCFLKLYFKSLTN